MSKSSMDDAGDMLGLDDAATVDRDGLDMFEGPSNAAGQQQDRLLDADFFKQFDDDFDESDIEMKPQ